MAAGTRDFDVTRLPATSDATILAVRTLIHFDLHLSERMAGAEYKSENWKERTDNHKLAYMRTCRPIGFILVQQFVLWTNNMRTRVRVHNYVHVCMWAESTAA